MNWTSYIVAASLLLSFTVVARRSSSKSFDVDPVIDRSTSADNDDTADLQRSDTRQKSSGKSRSRHSSSSSSSRSKENKKGSASVTGSTPTQGRPRPRVDSAAGQSARARASPVVTYCVSMHPPVHLECLDYLALLDYKDFKAWQDPQEFLVCRGRLVLAVTTVCRL